MLPERLIALCTRAIAMAAPVVRDGAALLARLTIGQAFLLAGLGKLGNLERTSDFFASLALPAPGLHAVLVGGIETLGGALLLLGLATRPAAAALAAIMLGAIATAHRSEFSAALHFSPEVGLSDLVPWMFLIVLLPLLAYGGGRLAVDHLLSHRHCAHRAPKDTVTPNAATP